MVRKKSAVAAAPASAEASTRQAWFKAGAGLTLIGVLLAALSIVDKDPAKDSASQPQPSLPVAGTAEGRPAGPAPTLVTTPGEPLITSAIALPENEEAVAAVLPPAPAGMPETSGAPEMAAPAARESDEAPLTAQAAASIETDSSPRLVLHSEPSEPDAVSPPQAAPAAAPATAKVPAGKGFMLQLGVFGHTANAESLYQELRRQGLPARLETRVVAGPFASRKSAEAARERLARAGLARGLIVPNK